MGIVGYMMMMLELTGLSRIAMPRTETNGVVEPSVVFQSGIFLLFYGAYFGILGRDIVQILADQMAHSIGVRHVILPSFFIQIFLHGWY